MAGYNTILKIRRLEKVLDDMGFMMCNSKYGAYRGEYGIDVDVVAIKPKDQDSLPIYARDAELFCGTIDALENWVHGVQWARDYDRMLFGKTHPAKRERKEQDYRNQKLLNLVKNSGNSNDNA